MLDAEVVLTMTTHGELQERSDEPRGRGGVVIAYDGSAGAAAAVAWAAGEAASRGAVLRVLFAADVIGSVLATPTMLSRDAREVGEEIAGEGAALARRAAGTDLDVVTEVHLTAPAATLLDASQHADLVVVGHRGRGAVVGALLGSVAFSVTSRAVCPVVVVRGDEQRRPGPDLPVVVGVDGSDHAAPAVAFAATTAARRGAALEVVAAWTAPEPSRPVDSTIRSGAVAAAVVERARSGADAAAQAAVTSVRSRRPGLAVRARAVRGNAADALAQASVDAGMVVVGARGHGSVAGLFLGSVSHATIHHAACPVAVVR